MLRSRYRIAISLAAIVLIAILAYWVRSAWFMDTNAIYGNALDQVEAGKFAEARTTLAKLRQRRPPTPLDHGLQARVEIAEGRIDEALHELSSIPDDHPLASWASLRAGQLERSRFRFRIAEELLRQALHLDDSLIEPRRELIYILGMQLRREELHGQFRALSRIASLTPKEIYVWCLVRDLAWWEASEQVPILEKALAADPQDDRSRVALAEILHRQSETDRALRVLEQSSSKSPYVEAKKAEILLDRDGPDSVSALLSKLPEDDPLTATLRGRTAMNDGDAQAAVRYFEIARKAEPGRRQVLSDLGRAWTLAGDPTQGKRFTERAGRIDNLNNLLLKIENTSKVSGVSEWRELAAACESAGRLPEARAWYGLVLKDSPLDEAAQSAIYRIDRTPDEDAVSR